MSGSSVTVVLVRLVATVFSQATKPTLRQSAARTVLSCKINRVRTLPRTNTQTFPSNKTKIRRHHNDITTVPTLLKSHDLQCTFINLSSSKLIKRQHYPIVTARLTAKISIFIKHWFLYQSPGIRLYMYFSFSNSLYYTLFFHSTFKTFVSVLIKCPFFLF